jgi:hypothetical protein
VDRAARFQGLAVHEVPSATHLPAEAIRREGEADDAPVPADRALSHGHPTTGSAPVRQARRMSSKHSSPGGFVQFPFAMGRLAACRKPQRS